VLDDATAALTSAMLEVKAGDAAVTAPQALRRAMISVRTGRKAYGSALASAVPDSVRRANRAS
jgi:hypothetical protein